MEATVKVSCLEQPAPLLALLGLWSTPETGGVELEFDLQDELTGEMTVAAGAVLRSPQGVLYYLGEVARVWNEDTKKVVAERRLPLIHVDHGSEKPFQCPEEQGETCVPLFLAREPSNGCDDALLRMEYRGRTYIVPEAMAETPETPETPQQWGANLCHPGRSMQSLTLVSQLLSLQKKGEKLPGTALVRVVGN